jgi:predicted small lipoprotein YifL
LSFNFPAIETFSLRPPERRETLALQEKDMIRGKMLAIALCALVLTVTACEKKGPVEKAGEKVDHVIDTIKNGGEETTTDKIQDEVDKARDKAAEATDKVEGK